MYDVYDAQCMICMTHMTSRAVAVGNTPGVLTEATADMGWALLMACARRIPEGNDFAKSDAYTAYDNMILLGQSRCQSINHTTLPTNPESWMQRALRLAAMDRALDALCPAQNDRQCCC